MNRKLLVIAMVPLLVGFAGAVAFSGYQGSISKQIQVTSATAVVTESVYCVGEYSQGNVPQTIQFSSGDWNGLGGIPPPSGPPPPPSSSVPCATSPPPSCTITCSSDLAPYLIGKPVTFLGPGVDSAWISISAEYLTPGSWYEFLLLDSVQGGPGEVGADISSGLSTSLSPEPANLLSAYGPSAWTFNGLTPTSSTPEVCYHSFVVPTGSPVEPVFTAGSSGHGFEYCDSGMYSPSSPLSLGPGDFTCSYVLIGLDENPGTPPYLEMGATGTFTVTTTATSNGLLWS